MTNFKLATLALAVAIAAAALAGCGPAAPPTTSAADMLTAVAKGQLAWPGDKVTVVYTSALLRGRQLVLVRGSTANGNACWLVDPASTVPGAELHRITPRKGCTAPSSAVPLGAGDVRQVEAAGSLEVVGRPVSLGPPRDGVVQVELVVNPEPSAAGGAVVTIPVTASDAEIIARGLRNGVRAVEIRARVNGAFIYPYSR